MCIVGPHCETFVDLGPGGQSGAVQKQLLTNHLGSWFEEHGAEPNELGFG